ncbi:MULTISPECIES: DNA-J related domain-containing protein [Shewanella]|uniref:DNA-J related domain-containing protein n=1 Tax=Shewanella TaxID=22 RepID=UPI00057A807E|nr:MULTISPECIES: DNA-J related domain-containing protein [Shewanella]NDO73394.1 DnaJ domain-containing protein [Shewanella sp. SE1]QWL06073.1 DnaJ domain-containing protein [Shewanella indica]TVP13663.1 molecular chaperone DnaJ [Shewanella sp. MSW]
MLLAKPALNQADVTEVKPTRLKGDNPLIWPILGLLKRSNRSWKVHHLATELQQQGLMHDLDPLPEKDLFKRNFLLMNALYELQHILLPGQWLQVEAMDIILLRIPPANVLQLQQDDSALRDYYLDWNNYDTCVNVVREMLESFWNSYQDYIGVRRGRFAQREALRVLELEADASDKEIRRQWRKLALKWHPDRQGGDAAKFRQICEAWQALRG